MGWRGVLRDMRAASRQAERDAARRRKALEKDRQQYERMQEAEQARYDVAVYDNRIDLLTSVHKECGADWDWAAVRDAPPPPKPARGKEHERRARVQLATYTPGVLDRLFSRADAKVDRLQDAVLEGRRRDAEDAQAAAAEYKAAVADWEASRALAARVLAGEPAAYLEVIAESNPFADLSVLGSGIRFKVSHPELIRAKLSVNGGAVIPAEVRSLRRDGKLSAKPMPKTQAADLYQDYVCGCVLRIARELFALLPVEMVIVTAVGEVLDPATGHLADRPVVSAAIPRASLGRIRWEAVDPSNAMANFIHRMCFKRGRGLFAVAPVEPAEVGY